MSRHKLVKNLDLDDELDDYDGGEDYDEDAGGEGLFFFSIYARIISETSTDEIYLQS